VGVLADLNPLLELFGFALAYALVSGFLIAVRPYVLWRRNMQNIVVGLATCVHSLWMVGAHSGGGTERVVYLAVLLALLGVVLLAFLGRETALGHSAWLRTHFSSAEQLEQEERLAAKRQALKTVDDDGQDDDAVQEGGHGKDAAESGRSFASVSLVDDEGATRPSGKSSGNGKGSSERETAMVDPTSSSEKSAIAGVEVEMVSINHSFPDSSASSGRKSPPPPPPPLPPSAAVAAGRSSAVSRCSPPPPLPHADATSDAALQANPALQLEDAFEEVESSELPPPPPPPPPRSSRLSGPPALPAQIFVASSSHAAAVPPPPLPPLSPREFASVHEDAEAAVSQEDAAPLQENWAVASDDVHLADQEE
jgi:hypothetical protein